MYADEHVLLSIAECPCGGDGSCVKNILNNMNLEQADNSVRTATVNKTGADMIQKSATVAGRIVFTYSQKDLFSLLNKNQGYVNVVKCLSAQENKTSCITHESDISTKLVSVISRPHALSDESNFTSPDTISPRLAYLSVYL